MMTHSLCHCCEQDPVIGVCTFAVYLRKPGNDLLLLGFCHLIEDALATHPYSHSNVRALHNTLIQVSNIAPVGIRIGWVCTIQQCIMKQYFQVYVVTFKRKCRKVGRITQPCTPSGSNAQM